MARSRNTASRELKTLLRLSRKARHNEASLNRLRTKVVRLVERANRMLDTLESHGYVDMAYVSATNYTQNAFGSDRYADPTDMDATSIYRMARDINHFLTLRTSTVSGQEQLNSERIAIFRDRFLTKRDEQGNITKQYKMSNKQILDFFKFLKRRPVARLLDSAGRYESGEIIENIATALNDDKSFDEIMKVLEAYWNTEEQMPYGQMPESQAVYYDELQKYLKGELSIYFNDKGQIVRKAVRTRYVKNPRH